MIRPEFCGALPKDAKTCAAYLCRWLHGRGSHTPTCDECLAYVASAPRPLPHCPDSTTNPEKIPAQTEEGT